MTHHTDDQYLMDAVLNCPHSITHDAITLHFSPKQKEGHNALAQLRHRLAAADAAAKAREMELLAVIEDLERLIPLINRGGDQSMIYEEIRFAWNAQADDEKQWNSLTEAEKVEWAARIGAEKERAARQKAQEEVVFLKEHIARAGVEHRRALHEALQQEREACAQIVERNAAAIRARTT